MAHGGVRVWSIEGKLTDDEIVAALQVDLVAQRKIT